METTAQDRKRLAVWGHPSPDTAREENLECLPSELAEAVRDVSGAANWYDEMTRVLVALVDDGDVAAIEAWGESSIWDEDEDVDGLGEDDYAETVRESFGALADLVRGED